jgi:hypothetical protein
MRCTARGVGGQTRSRLNDEIIDSLVYILKEAPRNASGEVVRRLPDAVCSARAEQAGALWVLRTSAQAKSNYRFDELEPVSKKVQVTIPKHIRDAAGVAPGSEVYLAWTVAKL